MLCFEVPKIQQLRRPDPPPDTTPGPRKARRVGGSKTQGRGGGVKHMSVSSRLPPTPTDVANLLFRLRELETPKLPLAS